MILDGIKILDLTRLAPGPFGTMILGDMGADVLKIEDTGAGDYIRTSGEKQVNESYNFLMLNRNKRSMCLNLKTDEGRNILKELVMEYDVVIEQFRPGVMDRLGVGYEDLRKVNPRVIYCSLSGYGQNGPMVQEPGHDLNYLALSGVLDSIRRPGEAPVIPGVYFGDMTCGMWAAIGVLAAIYHREHTGLGQYVDTSIYEGLIPMMNMYAGRYFAAGHNVERAPQAAGYNIYETADGRYISIAAAEPKFWKKLCTLLGREDFIDRLGDGEAGQAKMRKAFSEIFRSRTQAEWNEILGGADAMYAPVLNTEEAFENEQFKARNMEWRIDHPVEGTVRSIGLPIKFSDEPAKVTRRPPMQAEHTAEVLRTLGRSDEEIARLAAEGAVRCIG